MAKLKNPLFSLSGKGGLGKAVSFVKRGGRNIAEKKPEVPDARTLAQLSWRHMYQKAVSLWHALSAAEKQEWESLARAKHMTGFAWFISQALKPNPGLYLPLQGGKMQGEIDMDKHRIQKLPLPSDDQEAASKKYHDDNLPSGGYTEGCRVYRNVAQIINSESFAYLTFDSQVYDTDEMHDLVTNTDRITIKTAGIYLITFHGYFAQNATGYRWASIRKNHVATSMDFKVDAQVNTETSLLLTTLSQCALNDYFGVRVWQNSGASLNIENSSYYSPHFMAQRVG